MPLRESTLWAVWSRWGDDGHYDAEDGGHGGYYDIDDGHVCHDDGRDCVGVLFKLSKVVEMAEK